MPLSWKTYQPLMPLSLTMTLSRTSPPEQLVFAPSSSPNTSKASRMTPCEKLQHLILPMTSSARTPIIVVGSLLPDWFLQERRMTLETPYIFPMKQAMKEPTSGLKSFESPMNTWPTREHTNASNRTPNISIGCLCVVISKTLFPNVIFPDQQQPYYAP